MILVVGGTGTVGRLVLEGIAVPRSFATFARDHAEAFRGA